MIPFLKYQKLYFLISGLVIAAGLLSIVTYGFRYAIDFTGGTTLEYRFDKAIPSSSVKQILTTEKIESIEYRGTNTGFYLKTKALDEKKEKALQNKLSSQLNSKVTVVKSETVGPTLGRETLYKTITASLLAIGGILLYMTFAFKGFNFALAAVLAMIHDFLVVVGSYSLISHFFGAELDTLFVTGVLTAMSFSVHDTIIVFDKIREYSRMYGKGNISDYANKALTETMVRSFNNSMTIVFMLLALVLLGGSTIRFFALTLLIGTISGTYSSPFIATPIVVWLEKRKKKA
ncbi:protein translocase subunit SecF [Candidatus Roizmanbacteria bacterium]|nr:protein translocase subunit SecF [Candidatus Roizmanbacteria bacterium]